ncbi:MAG: GatB/YqeY domain-containing protein [Betaproteobacteria bacterium]|nr:GatB/YqeY domain-containing protein [Betaproteobacteria bacterium]
MAPFLPPPPDAKELSAAVDAAVAECGAVSARDLGRVMAAIKTALPGADLAEAGKLAKQKLSG